MLQKFIVFLKNDGIFIDSLASLIVIFSFVVGIPVYIYRKWETYGKVKKEIEIDIEIYNLDFVFGKDKKVFGEFNKLERHEENTIIKIHDNKELMKEILIRNRDSSSAIRQIVEKIRFIRFWKHAFFLGAFIVIVLLFGLILLINNKSSQLPMCVSPEFNTSHAPQFPTPEKLLNSSAGR